jgi:hypothetical protein
MEEYGGEWALFVEVAMSYSQNKLIIRAFCLNLSHKQRVGFNS